MQPVRKTAAALALALLSPVLAGCGIGGGGGSYRVVAYFPRAVALYEQGQVRVLGLPAGRVKDVTTEQECGSPDADGPCVRVVLSLDEDVALPEDVAATLIPQSLIGERYVQLTPAYTDEDAAGGKPRLSDLPEDQRVIPLERAVIPVEPDEALAALNRFLQSLDPEGLGRLITNAEEDLRGNGQTVNSALGSLSDLVDTFAQRDDELAAIVDNFDVFTQTLVTREGQIGEIIDSFARTTNVLAQERHDLETLLAGLARISEDGLDLVSEHAAALRTDLTTLSQLGQSLVANLDAVEQLLDGGPLLTDGLADAYSPDLRAMRLVTSLGPIAFNVLNPLLNELLGVTLGCVPIDTVCVGDGLLNGLSGSNPVVTEVAVARTPIDDVLDVLGSPLAPAGGSATGGRAPSAGDRAVDGLGSFGRFLRDAAETLVGAG